MSDQLTDFLRVVPHERTPNYQAALLSVLRIALNNSVLDRRSA
jgi:hypothetical protein